MKDLGNRGLLLENINKNLENINKTLEVIVERLPDKKLKPAQMPIAEIMKLGEDANNEPNNN